ncbi:MAG: DUF2252 domain-containing protein [Pirellulales bacterium]|nr:DUF2252 domain-containing protein [Pirellulales bacterium]
MARTRTEKKLAGKALRTQVPRASHGAWNPGGDGRDPLEIIERSNEGRLRRLAPLRYGRMLRSPFAFLRGSPALMAYDLVQTPVTRKQVQTCGDCHLLNFGLFGTPERNLIFDINDFDETLQGAWEWDLKRLAASVVVAGRSAGVSEPGSRDAALACCRSYRQHLAEYAELSPLEIWYACVRAEDLIGIAPNAQSRKRREHVAAKARRRISDRLFPKITRAAGQGYRFVERPPVKTRVTDERLLELARQGFADYRTSLAEERRCLFDRYQLHDLAWRVVGIGSVGTRCLVALFLCDDRSPLLLQVKEARPSVFEAYTGQGPFENHGQRVVVGQRLTQSASDLFLGWARVAGHDFYVRQLRDMKYSLPVESFNAVDLEHYAQACGWTLARAHATSGDPAIISGYLGNGDNCDRAMTEFAQRYADQVERDHEALTAAHAAGHIEAIIEADD